MLPLVARYIVKLIHNWLRDNRSSQMSPPRGQWLCDSNWFDFARGARRTLPNTKIQDLLDRRKSGNPPKPNGIKLVAFGLATNGM